ncbi:MAG: LamG-like jellyroll fold domain-containing protein, partial [Akkermansiaceae bacterium]
NVSVGGAPILLDVLRNDYDANNDPIQIWRTRLISGGQVSTTELGGTMAISSGTGPGGRDQILYTPPANGTPGAVDRFYYDVEDDPSLGGALTNFGQVKVTLEPDIRPKEINPASYLADTAEEFSGEVNPVTEQIGQDAGGNDIFRDVWHYGFFNRGTQNFTTTTGQQTDSAVVVGAENSGWIGSGGSRIHKYAMLPGDSYDAAKRWTSNYTGPIVIVYEAARLDEGGNGSQLRVALNGANIWTQSISDSNRQRAGRIELEVEKGATVDFVLDGLGSRTGDWTYWRARILKSTQAKWLDAGSPVAEYRLDIAGTYPAERRIIAVDGSGNDYHASLQGHDSPTAWISAEIENGLRFDGTDDQVNFPQPSELQGSSEFSVSVWVNAEDFTDNCAVLTSINDSDANLSYFGILMAAAADDSPVQFRAHRTAINAPGGSFELNRWIHITGVWKAGETQKLYLDGVEVASNSNPPGGTIDIDRWVMGRDRAIANRFFTGTIDDLALFDRVLSPAEITAIYQQSRYKEFYDGVDDFKDEASPLPGNGAEEVTISAWVRASSLDDNRGIVTSYNSDDPNRSYFGLLVGPESAGRPAQFRAHRELVNALPGSFPIGEWSHIVGVWKAEEEQSLYIDGTKVAENNDPPSGSIDIERWITGRDRLINGRFFDGSISEQLIMPRAMNAGEVQELYEVGLLNYPATQGFIEQAGQIGTQSGSMEEASGILMTTTRGSGIGGTSDTFFFASRTHRGDGEVTVRLDGLNETGSGAKSGVMFRTSTEANSPFVYLWQYGDGRLGFRSRASAGATAQTLEQVTHPPTYPLWLRLSRQGNEFFATWSEDQETWQLLGTTTLVMPQDLEVGVAHQSHNSTVSIAHYGDLQLSNVVNTIPDSDLDGLVDAWEIANFGDLNQNASGDFDHDGINNLLERFYGTSPLIPDESPPAPTISRANGTFVSANSVWKYLDDGSNQGTAWREPGFDDSAWALGAQPLGYGEASLGTTVGHGDSIFNRHITTYFRRSFFVDDPNTFTGLNFTVTRDDGVVLYLNGAQKLRSNVPLNFDFQTPASFGVNGGAEGTPINVPVNTSDLVEGWNVLAAEVHQESNTSSDLFFTAEFTGTLPAGVPEGSHLSVKFPRSKDASDWNIIVEVTSDLATWSPVTSPVVVLEDLGATEMVQVFDSVPFNITDRRFIRIRVQAP